MNVIFLRHGIAIERDDPKAPPNDADRALTREGRQKMKEAARGVRALEIPVDRIVSSPLMRARQTAEILSEAFDPPLVVEILDTLAPGMDLVAVLRHLDSHCGPEANVVLVGHDPDFSEAVARLAFGASAGTFGMKKGGMACVEIESVTARPRGNLRWLLPPSILRAAGAGG